jgi:enamine deaminase RidA (YjgF/YER057c/UK114 family)
MMTRVLGLPETHWAFSQALVCDGWLFTAGIGPFDPHTRQIFGTTIADQTYQTMVNLQQILEAAGTGFDEVVKVTVHLQHLLRDFAGFDERYRTFFDSAPYPVRTTVGSDLRNILVEIDLIARITPTNIP